MCTMPSSPHILVYLLLSLSCFTVACTGRRLRNVGSGKTSHRSAVVHDPQGNGDIPAGDHETLAHVESGGSAGGSREQLNLKSTATATLRVPPASHGKLDDAPGFSMDYELPITHSPSHN